MLRDCWTLPRPPHPNFRRTPTYHHQLKPLPPPYRQPPSPKPHPSPNPFPPLKWTKSLEAPAYRHSTAQVNHSALLCSSLSKKAKECGELSSYTTVEWYCKLNVWKEGGGARIHVSSEAFRVRSWLDVNSDPGHTRPCRALR